MQRTILMRCALAAISLALIGCTALEPGTDRRDSGSQRDSGSDAQVDAGADAAAADAALDAHVPSDAGPQDAGPPRFPVQVALGYDHSCITNGRGGVVCWGANDHGQLGRSVSFDPLPPALVSGLTDVDEVCAGHGYTCARVATDVSCWGFDGGGRLGNGPASGGAVPQLVQGLPEGVTHLACGPDTACAIADSDLYCWGSNSFGQFTSDLAADHYDSAVRLPLGDHVLGPVAVGAAHTCAVLDVTPPMTFGWGNNDRSQISAETTGIVDPTAMGQRADAIALGLSHTCLLRAGSVTCRGAPGEWTTVPSASTVTDIRAGLEFTCLVDTNGIECWGSNDWGQLGSGTSPHRITQAGTTIVQLAAGAQHACALTAEDLYCWGANQFHQAVPLDDPADPGDAARVSVTRVDLLGLLSL